MPDNKNNIDLVNVQVDGHWIKVKKGTRMIEACKQAEAEVLTIVITLSSHLLEIAECVWLRWECHLVQRQEK